MTPHTTSPASANRWLLLPVFLVAVIGIGFVIGMLTAPGAWYAALTKPWFNPPNWLFGPVWAVLYVIIALTGWHLFTTRPRSAEMRLWWAQIVLNFLWSPMFFALHLPALGLLVIANLALVLVFFIRRTWTAQRIVALGFVPYLVWASFATMLNLSIVVLN